MPDTHFMKFWSCTCGSTLIEHHLAHQTLECSQTQCYVEWESVMVENSLNTLHPLGEITSKQSFSRWLVLVEAYGKEICKGCLIWGGECMWWTIESLEPHMFCTMFKSLVWLMRNPKRGFFNIHWLSACLLLQLKGSQTNPWTTIVMIWNLCFMAAHRLHSKMNSKTPSKSKAGCIPRRNKNGVNDCVTCPA